MPFKVTISTGKAYSNLMKVAALRIESFDPLVRFDYHVHSEWSGSEPEGKRKGIRRRGGPKSVLSAARRAGS